MGVQPTGAQVLRTFGINRKPLSSRNTRWAPRRAAFFYPGPFVGFPSLNGRLVPLEGASFGFLPTPAEALSQQLPHANGTVADSELSLDQPGNALESPQLGRVPSSASPSYHHPPQTFPLDHR